MITNSKLVVIVSVIVTHYMAPLFSKVDLNRLWHDVQNEETLIYAKFGKDLFNISKVIGRKKWHSFLTRSVDHCIVHCVYHMLIVSLLVFLELHLTTSELWFGQEQEGILP